MAQQEQVSKLTDISRRKIDLAQKYRDEAISVKDPSRKKILLDDAATLLREAREIAEVAKSLKG